VKIVEEKDLPTLIKKIRGAASLAEFARRFGVSRQLVHQWETGRSHPSPEVLEAVGIEVIYRTRIS